MSDEASLIDAVRLVAKAAKDNPDDTASLVKGALHGDQIDAVRVMLSKAREGSLINLVASQGAADTSAAASADDPGAQSLRPLRSKGGLGPLTRFPRSSKGQCRPRTRGRTTLRYRLLHRQPGGRPIGRGAARERAGGTRHPIRRYLPRRKRWQLCRRTLG